MKKVLLASTALLAFAGAAAAEVTLSGSAEMGVVGGSGDADVFDIESQFMQSIDVRFSLSGETDNGLTFGGSIDLEDSMDIGASGSDSADVLGYADFVVFVSGEFGTVTMGDTDGALDWALTDPASVGNPGSIADNETAHAGRQDSYLDGAYDGQILRYDYAYEGFGFAVSLEQDDRSDAELKGSPASSEYVLNPDTGVIELETTSATSDTDRGDYNWAVGVKWAGEVGPGTVKVGAGYQASDYATLTLGSDDYEYKPFDESENASVYGVSAGYVMDNGFSVGAVYSNWDADSLDSGSHWAVGAGYSFDAFSIHANYGIHSFENDSGDEFDFSGWGLAAGYDLGGGLSILAGYGSSTANIDFDDSAVEDIDDGSWSNWSLGLSMSF